MPITVSERAPVVTAVADGGKPTTRKTGKAIGDPSGIVYYVQPEYRIPEESKDKLDDGVASHVRAWELKGDETMHPFWAVERLTECERKKAEKGAFNMKLEEKEFAAATVGALTRDSVATTFAVVVPIMTNAVAVKKGDELSLEIIVRKETKRKEGSWKTDVARDAQAPKAKAKAKTAANSLEVATEI